MVNIENKRERLRKINKQNFSTVISLDFDMKEFLQDFYS